MFVLKLARLPIAGLVLVSFLVLPRALSGSPVTLSRARLDLGPLGSADIGVRMGVVESLLMLLVSGIGLVVATYSARNLVGQRGLVRYAVLETVTVTALVLTVTASSLPVLATGWTVATVTLSGLVAHSGTARARWSARQIRFRLLSGDVLLWAAVVVLGAGAGTLDRAGLAERVAAAPAGVVTLAALLIIGAGVVRSALLPGHRWLPETAEAPSPVSALLHAGMVNGVGVLVLLLWPVVAAAPAARLLLLVLGATTAVVATAQMRTRADVKGRLAASTSSQMGYLAVQAALGVPAAVLAHVIGHGVWKASLFLGAGGAVERSLHRDATPRARLSRPTVIGAGAAAVTAVAAAAVLPASSWPTLTAPGELLPLAMATGVSAMALIAVLRHQGPRVARAVASALVLAVGIAYVIGLRALGDEMAAAVGEPQPWESPEGWPTAVAVLLLLGVGVIGARVDRAARRSTYPTLARRAARSSLPPLALRERVTRRPRVAMAIPPVTDEDATVARHLVHVAARTCATLYPLDSFVASNPVAGLEDLSVEDAMRIATEVWGVQSGPSADALRQALAAHQIEEADIDAAIDGVLGGDRRIDHEGSCDDQALLVRVLLLSDDPARNLVAGATSDLHRAGVEPERVLRTPLQVLHSRSAAIDRRARDLAHHVCTRSLAGPSWPGAPGPWQELRATATSLDGMLQVRGIGDLVAALPAGAPAAIAVLFEHLGVLPGDRSALLARLLARDPGWPAHLVWRARHSGLGRQAGLDDSSTAGVAEGLLEELVATRLVIEVALAEAHAPRLLGRPFDAADMVAASHDERARYLAAALSAGLVGPEPAPDEVRRLMRVLEPLAGGGLALLRTDVLERAFRRRLLGVVAARAGQSVRGPASGPAAQLVTCIDVRSERLRRHLESIGPWETLGAAGFFGLPLRYVAATGVSTERAPALLRPVPTVSERPGPGGTLSGTEDSLRSAVRAVEAMPGLPFGWAEVAGWMYAPFVAMATVLPRYARALREASRRALGAPRCGDLDVAADVGVEPLAGAAADFIATLGTSTLAELVVLVGHGGRISNNPHVAAYDCGACGGCAGDVNARVMARALNDPAVRARLRARGVTVPPDTWFVAALHDTTRDLVEVFDRQQVPARLQETLERLEVDLGRAGAQVRAERLGLLPHARSGGVHRLRREVEDRAADWAQPRPEWGLAGAAAIVVAPRELTAGLHLDGRVFLQSYRSDLDPGGTVLEQLLAAPVVVAQWITAQYWASTVDPHRFGAGDKTTHNIVGDGHALSAVFTGARGDLRIGLPWQAVSPTAPTPEPAEHAGPWRAATRHEPVRLLAVVCAEPALIEGVLTRQPTVSRLVAGGWITLSAVKPHTGHVVTRTRDGVWVATSATAKHTQEPRPRRART
ncbi:MAG: Na-translocating system protein MpsB [Actinomycetota bacterium]|nr:Na-translocating system protein MpsB [Actinomycetota bacterium]